MRQYCPHCGTALPSIVDAFCPECREDLDTLPDRAVQPGDGAAGPAAALSPIVGAEAMSPQELADEIERGGRLVVYYFCLSLFLVTFLQPTQVYLIRSGKSARWQGLKFTLISLLVGWWGIPWGFIYTPWAVVINSRGGKDVTAAFLPNLP